MTGFGSSFGTGFGGGFGSTGFGATNNAKNESSGGWSKAGNKGSDDNLQSGGWGKKVQQTVGLGNNFFGNSNTNKTGFGTKQNNGFGGFGTGQNSAFGGFGTGFGTGQNTGFSGGFGSSFGGSFGNSFGSSFGLQKPQQVSVPITTIGLPFTAMEKEDRAASGQRKKFKVFHINMIEMFSQFTTEQLRFYDYLKTGAIPPLEGTTQLPNTSLTTGFQTSSITANQSQQKIINHNKHWYQVPLDKWKPIMKIISNEDEKKKLAQGEVVCDQIKNLQKPYSELPKAGFEVSKITKKEEETHPPIKLKGFKPSNITFESHLNNFKSDQKLFFVNTTTELEQFKFKYQQSMTPTTTYASTAGPSSTSRSKTTGRITTSNQSKLKSAASQSSLKPSSQLSFIPNILRKEKDSYVYDTNEKDELIIDNLMITNPENSYLQCTLIFPNQIDVVKLNPFLNVNISYFNPPGEEKGTNKEKYIVETHTVKVIIQENDLDKSTQTLIYVKSESHVHFLLKSEDNSINNECDGTFLSAMIPLKCYPLTIKTEIKKNIA